MATILCVDDQANLGNSQAPAGDRRDVPRLRFPFDSFGGRVRNSSPILA